MQIIAQHPKHREYRQYRVHYFGHFGGPGSRVLISKVDPMTPWYGHLILNQYINRLQNGGL